MAINAEQLNIILAARDKEFTKAMDRSQRRVERFAAQSQKNLTKTSKSFDGLGRAAKRLAPIMAAAFSVSAMRGAIESTANLGILANVAGVNVERFQEMAFAARTFGIEQDKLADILKDVNDKFGDYVQTGAGPLADFFEQIAPKVGITADAFANLSSSEKLGAYIGALEKANVSQADMTFYLEAIASDATLLKDVFGENGKELDRLSEKLQSTGGVLSAEMIENARKAKEELALASDVINRNLSQALVDLSPILTTATSLMASLARTTKNAADEAAQLAGLIAFGRDQNGPVMIGTPREAGYFTDGDIEKGRGSIYDKPRRVREFGPPTFDQYLKDTMSGIVGGGRGEDPRKFGFDALEAAMNRYNSAFEETNVKSNKAAEGTKKLKDEISDMEIIMRDVEMSMEDAFMAMIDGTSSAQDAFRAMAKDIIRELYRVLVVQSLVGSFEENGGGILGSVFGAIGKASGGPVQAGRPQIVGEHGRELFVPQNAGRVLSVSQAKDAVRPSSPTVNVTYSFQGGVTQADLGRALPQLVEATKRAMMDSVQRGGAVAKVFR